MPVENQAFEFHDSVLASITREGDDLTLTFNPAYVHRSSGEPGTDAGTGWTTSILVIVRGGATSNVATLPQDVASGSITVGSTVCDNVVPLPFAANGAVRILVELVGGERLNATGTGVSAVVVGESTFVENFGGV
jgi:hypothetical protein